MVGSALADSSKVFVLVHGAWVGEWYWDPVVEGLERRGHVAVAVSLRGHGRASSQGGPHVTLLDHIEDVAAAIRGGDYQQVYLVSHSYGGKPATGVWDLMRSRVKHVVYVDAMAPLDEGDIAFLESADTLVFLRRQFPNIVRRGMLPVPSRFPVSMQARSTPQSLNTLYGELKLAFGPLPASTNRTFVVTSGSRIPSIGETVSRLRRDQRWQIIEIESGHNVVRDAAGALVNLLDSLQ